MLGCLCDVSLPQCWGVCSVLSACSVRLKKAPKKKYGLLSSYDDTVEMKHLEESDDDDDDTVYEARSLRR